MSSTDNYGASTLRLILDNLQDQVYVTDVDTYEIIFANKTIRTNFPDAVPGRKCYQALEDRTEPCEYCGIKVLQGKLGEGRSWQHYNAKCDLWLNVSEICVPWGDGRTAHIVSAANITELKRKQEELDKAQRRIEHNSKMMAEIADNLVSSAVYRTTFVDDLLRLDYASPMLEQLSGIPLDVLYKSMKPFYRNIHPDDMGPFRDKIRSRGGSLDEDTFEFRYILNGETMWYKVYSRGFEQDDHIVRDGILVDMTANKLREQKLRASYEEARRAKEDQNRFMATISHELRTPMNAIIGFMDILSTSGGEIDEGTQQDYMRIVSENANHLLKLIGDVLDVSKLDASQVTLMPVDANLDLLMEDIRSSFLVSKNMQDKQIDLILDRAETPLENVSLDVSRLRQVLVNLIGNAIKFTDRGHVRFGYKVVKDKILFHVEDTGLGIAPEKIPELGRPFIQVHDRSLAAKYRGTGLGLSISFNIVKLMGGKFKVASQPGKGTRFEFTVALPGK